MFSTLLLDINKTLTNSILYQVPQPLRQAGVPRYCPKVIVILRIRSIRQSIMQLCCTMLYPCHLVRSVVKESSFDSFNSVLKKKFI